MDTDMRSKVDAAKHLYHETGRISELDSQRCVRGPMSVDDQTDGQEGKSLPQGGALPVSAPNSLASKLLKVTVTDAAAKEDLSNRLHEAKSSLRDLCSRQLNDLLDEAPSDQKAVEDVDVLLSEMQAVRRSMETLVAIERALHDS
ncbi:hypothetical protein LTR70_000287 [Exophiala xenobiotica]|uniref:Uncharacterized protein n=1 Tax=Lithohypha guttulata TaxID=1690604 RepID=A0ABR0K4Z7_9EURO|nr:hypothetical protein LTR24_006738 [Lithohypha guttulata]KAK5330965.1 hypothetical protein LTR70_000287 [Exophiala xenobiotica]